MVASRIGPPVSRSTCFTSTGRDLWRNPIEERKALLRRVLDRVRCPHQIYVDHVLAGAPNCSTTCARSAPRGSSLSALGRSSEGRARVAQDQVPRHRPIYRYQLPGTRQAGSRRYTGRRRFADGVLAHVRTPGLSTSTAQPLLRLARFPSTSCS